MVESSMSDFTIIIDTREQRPLFFRDVETIRRALKTGDYSIEGCEDRVSIERKSLEDLLSCVTSRREAFNDQMTRLLSFESKALLIEARPLDLEQGNWFPKVHPNAVIGTVLKWKMKGIPVIYANGQEQAAKYVAWFMRLFWERKYE
jgi:DNA excision repair protein ERCC-4